MHQFLAELGSKLGRALLAAEVGLLDAVPQTSHFVERLAPITLDVQVEHQDL